MAKNKFDESYVSAGIRIAIQPLVEERDHYIEEYNSTPYEYTEATLKRIRKLFRRQRLNEFRKTAVRWSKRVAVFFMVLLTLTFVACAAIKPLREKLANAFLTWYDEYVEVQVDDSAESEVKLKVPTYIPEGYYILENLESNGNLMITYMNSDEVYLDFSRIIMESDTHMLFDSDSYLTKNITVGELECILIYSLDDANDNMITWSEDGLMYRISAYLPISELVKIVENVK